MKALVKNKPSRGLWLEEVPEPEIGINDVKVRVLLTGICGTGLKTGVESSAILQFRQSRSVRRVSGYGRPLSKEYVKTSP